jgi:hypothetical protein
MTLAFRGASYTVMFSQPDGVVAQPIVDYANPVGTDDYSVTLKFFQL